MTSIILMTVGVASLRTTYRAILTYAALGGIGVTLSGALAFISTSQNRLYRGHDLTSPDDSLTSHTGD